MSIEKDKKVIEKKKKKQYDFDAKNNRRNQWYEQNIIVPKMEAAMKDFETEIQYRDQKVIAKQQEDLKLAELKK